MPCFGTAIENCLPSRRGSLSFGFVPYGSPMLMYEAVLKTPRWARSEFTLLFILPPRSGAGWLLRLRNWSFADRRRNDRRHSATRRTGRGVSKFSQGLVSSVIVELWPVKRHRGEPGHTRDTRGHTVTRNTRTNPRTGGRIQSGHRMRVGSSQLPPPHSAPRGSVGGGECTQGGLLFPYAAEGHPRRRRRPLIVRRSAKPGHELMAHPSNIQVPSRPRVIPARREV